MHNVGTLVGNCLLLQLEDNNHNLQKVKMEVLRNDNKMYQKTNRFHKWSCAVRCVEKTIKQTEEQKSQITNLKGKKLMFSCSVLRLGWAIKANAIDASCITVAYCITRKYLYYK